MTPQNAASFLSEIEKFSIGTFSPDFRYPFVYNIPRNVKTSKLRVLFSPLIEQNKFICFHFKHRKNVLAAEEDQKLCCSFIKLTTDAYDMLKCLYNDQIWQDDNNQRLNQICKIMIVNDQILKETNILSINSLSDIDNLPEMNPPLLMPHGNVGTPTKHFVSLISECKMPSKLISSLGLTFITPKAKFGTVNLTYNNPNILRERLYSPLKEDDENNKNSDQSEPEEEWDRHCRLHDDVDKQGRTKERLFEDEKEIVWEKGGSGLVWYTDAAYWDKFEGTGNIFEERCPDDWDLDMSIYDDPTSGDKDARDLYSIQMKDADKFDGWQRGMKPVAGEPKKIQNKIIRKAKKFIQEPQYIYQENYDDKEVKGIGKDIIEKRGWKRGQGLGKRNTGIPQPLPIRGQHPKLKSGFGYPNAIDSQIGWSDSDEEGGSNNTLIVRKQARILNKDVIIATVYDREDHKNFEVPANCSIGPHHIKYR